MRFNIREFDWPLLKAVAIFSGWVFLNQICDLVNQNVPNIILGAACGTAAVAVFAVSIKIRNVFISLASTLSNVFIPHVNRVVAEGGDDGELTRILIRVGKYQMALLCWVFGSFIVLGKFFIAKWAGEDFMDAYWMLILMVCPLIIPLSQNVGIEIQKAKNMHRARSVAYLLIALISVGFSIALSPRLGYWATAIAYASSITLGNVLFMNWYYHNRVGLDMFKYWSSNLPIIVSCAISVAICLLGTSHIPVSNFARFFIWGAVFSTLYILSLLLLVLGSDDRERLFALRGQFAAKRRQ